MVSVGLVGLASFGRFGVSVESTEPSRTDTCFGSVRFGGSVVRSYTTGVPEGQNCRRIFVAVLFAGESCLFFGFVLF